MRYLDEGEPRATELSEGPRMSQPLPPARSGFGGDMSGFAGGPAVTGGPASFEGGPAPIATGAGLFSGGAAVLAGGPAPFTGGAATGLAGGPARPAGHTGRLELGQTTNPRDLVPGNPEEIRNLASILMTEAAKTRSLAQTLSTQNPQWTSESAQIFHSRQSTAQQGFSMHAATMEQTGRSLQSYANTLASAQAQASQAIALHAQSIAAGSTAASPAVSPASNGDVRHDDSVLFSSPANSVETSPAQTMLNAARSSVAAAGATAVAQTTTERSFGFVTQTGPGSFQADEKGFTFTGSSDLKTGDESIKLFTGDLGDHSWRSYEGRIMNPHLGDWDASGKASFLAATGEVEVSATINRNGLAWYDKFGLKMDGNLNLDVVHLEGKSTNEVGWFKLTVEGDGRLGAGLDGDVTLSSKGAEFRGDAYLAKGSLGGKFEVGNFLSIEGEGGARYGQGYERWGRWSATDDRLDASGKLKLGPFDVRGAIEFDGGKMWDFVTGQGDPSFDNVVGGSSSMPDYVGTVTVGNDVWSVHAGEGTDYGAQHLSGPGNVSVSDFHQTEGTAAAPWDSEFYSPDGQWIGPEDGGYGTDDFGGSDFGSDDFGSSDFGGSDFGGSDFGGSDFGGSDFGGSDFGGSDFGGGDFGGGDFGSSSGGGDFGGGGASGDWGSGFEGGGGDFGGGGASGDWGGGDFGGDFGSDFGSDFGGGGGGGSQVDDLMCQLDKN